MTKNNKVSINQKFDRKLQNSKFDFSKNFKFFSIISLVIIFIGVMIFSFLGFNLGSDFASLSTVKIYTNSEKYIIEDGISAYDIDNKEDYNKVVEIIEGVLNKNNTSIVSVEKSTIDILDKNIKSAKALQVTFYNDTSLTEEELSSFNTSLKTQLLEKFGYVQENSVNIENAVSNVETINNYNQSLDVIYSAVIALVVSVVFALIYLSLRYEKAAFVTGFITILHDILVTLALLAIVRIPLTLACVGTVGFVFVLSIINLIMYYSKSKELTTSGVVDKFKASLVANETSKSNVKFNLYLYSTLLIISALLIAVTTMQIRYFALTLFIASIVCWFSAQFILNGFYRMVYKPVKKNRKFV